MGRGGEGELVWRGGEGELVCREGGCEEEKRGACCVRIHLLEADRTVGKHAAKQAVRVAHIRHNKQVALQQCNNGVRCEV